MYWSVEGVARCLYISETCTALIIVPHCIDCTCCLIERHSKLCNYDTPILTASVNFWHSTPCEKKCVDTHNYNSPDSCGFELLYHKRDCIIVCVDIL